MKADDKLPMCSGCRDDFYNDKNPLGVKRCWSLESAQVVTRYRLGWWTQPTSPSAFTKVRTLSCHNAPGQYALYKAENLPPGFLSQIESKEALEDVT